MELMKRFRSDVTLNDEKTVATVTYRFRGLAEAEAFQQFVEQSIRLFNDFKDESDDMDKFCEDNNCSEF